MWRRHSKFDCVIVNVTNTHTNKKHSYKMNDEQHKWDKKRQGKIYILCPLKSWKIYTSAIKKTFWFALVIAFLSEQTLCATWFCYTETSSLNFINIRHWHVLVCYFSALFATTCCEPTTQFEFRCCFFFDSDIIAFILNKTNANMYVHVKIYAELVYVY